MVERRDFPHPPRLFERVDLPRKPGEVVERGTGGKTLIVQGGGAPNPSLD